MKFIRRELETTLKELIGRNKVILLMGTRRVGKTVLADTIRQAFEEEVVFLNGED